MNGLPSLFSNHLDSFFKDSFPIPFHHFGPAFGSINVKNKKDMYELTMNLPGLSEDDISLEIKDSVLTIKANKEMKKDESTPEGKDEGFVVQEFSSVSATRSFTVPREVDSNNISASLDKGRLIVTLPKSKDQSSEPKKISIKK